jgi:hypothetical protein
VRGENGQIGVGIVETVPELRATPGVESLRRKDGLSVAGTCDDRVHRAMDAEIPCGHRTLDPRRQRHRGLKLQAVDEQGAPV